MTSDAEKLRAVRECIKEHVEAVNRVAGLYGLLYRLQDEIDHIINEKGSDDAE